MNQHVVCSLNMSTEWNQLRPPSLFLFLLFHVINSGGSHGTPNVSVSLCEHRSIRRINASGFHVVSNPGSNQSPLSQQLFVWSEDVRSGTQEYSHPWDNNDICSQLASHIGAKTSSLIWFWRGVVGASGAAGPSYSCKTKTPNSLGVMRMTVGAAGCSNLVKICCFPVGQRSQTPHPASGWQWLQHYWPPPWLAFPSDGLFPGIVCVCLVADHSTIWRDP